METQRSSEVVGGSVGSVHGSRCQLVQFVGRGYEGGAIHDCVTRKGKNIWVVSRLGQDRAHRETGTLGRDWTSLRFDCWSS